MDEVLFSGKLNGFSLEFGREGTAGNAFHGGS